MQEYIHKINKTLAHTKNITSSVTGRISKFIVLFSVSIKILTNICEQALHGHLDYTEMCIYIISKLLKEWYLLYTPSD